MNTYGWDLALPCLSEKWGKGFRCLNTDVWTILDASTFIPEVQWFLMVSGHNYQTHNVVSEEREQQDLTLKLASEWLIRWDDFHNQLTVSNLTVL